jgi:hypothetical protein
MSGNRAEQIRPEDCPEPGWHETHHYCPACSWTNPDAPVSEETKLRKENARLRAALRGLAETHHRTVTPSKHHDPENKHFEDCIAGSCASARIALERSA